MSQKEFYRVGAADDADIVMKQPTVSKYHAELRWSDGSWQIRDLDSTNGTFVDGRRIQTWEKVEPQQRITLGRDTLLALPAAPTNLDLSQPAPHKTATKSPPLPAATMALYSSLACVFLCVFVVIFVSRRSSRDDSKEEPRTLQNATAENRVDDTSKSESNVAVKEGSVVPDRTNPAAAVDKAKVSAIWAVVLESADRTNRRLVGTAVAVEDQRLLTLASIMDAYHQSQQDYPHCLLVQPAQESIQLDDADIQIHPQYTEGMKKLAEFENALDQKLKEVDTSESPSLEDRIDWSRQLETISASVTTHDLAVIKVGVSLKATMPIEMDWNRQEPRSCTLSGYPMFLPSPKLTEAIDDYVLNGKASLKLDRKLNPPMTTVGTEEMMGLPLTSLACVSDRQSLLGFCVRDNPKSGLESTQRCQVNTIDLFWKQ